MVGVSEQRYKKGWLVRSSRHSVMGFLVWCANPFSTSSRHSELIGVGAGSPCRKIDSRFLMLVWSCWPVTTMIRYFYLTLLFAFVTAGKEKFQPGPKLIDETTRWSECKSANQSLYDFQVETLEGEFTDLSQYKGQVLLVINVATFCAYTQQYTDFNPLIDKNRENGKEFTILAFPCNQFYLQEPAENHEILNGIVHVRPGNGWQPNRNLHIYGKLEVNGQNHHPLYEFLKDSCPQTVVQIGKRDELIYNPIRVNDVTWNFEKFLVDKKGRPRYRFHPTAWSHGEIVQPFIEKLQAE